MLSEGMFYFSTAKGGRSEETPWNIIQGSESSLRKAQMHGICSKAVLPGNDID